MYDRVDTAPTMVRAPIRSALDTACENLSRCEGLILELRNHIHGDQPSPALGTKGGPTPPPPVSHGVNEIAQRTSALGDMLSELCSSF